MERFANINAMLGVGMLPLFELKSGNRLLVLCDNSKVIIEVPIVESGKSFYGYVNTSNEQLETAISNFITDNFKSTYPDMTRKVTIKTKPYAFTADDFIVTGIAKQSVGGLQKYTYYEKLLAPEGFDFSAFKKSVVVSTARDYSACQLDEEAQMVLKDNAAVFSYFTPNINDWADNVKLAYYAVQQGKVNLVIFKGPAGTGKSILAREFAYLMKAPLLSMQCTDGTTADDLMGKAVVNTDPSVPGQFTYALGPVLKCRNKGWQQLLDEGNMSQANCINILNQFGDDTNIIEWDGKSYTCSPNFVLYFTMNSGYEGTNSLNAALKSRTIVVDVPRLTKTEFADRLFTYVTNKLSATLSKDFCKEVFSFTEYMQETAKKFAENVEFCIRNGQKLCALVLTKACSESEFTAAVYESYVDFLSMDNDNTDTLNILKQSVEMKDKIKKLYNLYDYKVVESVDESKLFSFDDVLFIDDEDSSSNTTTSGFTSNESSSFDEDLDDLDNFLNSDAKEINENEEA
jgi:hypothetical protein